MPITSPTAHHAATWARSSISIPVKDSARGPDPEHLKALWSQTSNKTGSHAVNSLEGIADDLTAIPFTLQDVKSEDGETPPPSVPTAVPSRMSLHDVTRAFQQVPSSSASAPSLRPTISPPSTTAPVARPPSYAYALPPNPMRPAYAPYPSPMLSHSPSPIMYSHPMAGSPIPSRMQVNGHAPMYGPHVWMPLPPNAQTPVGMMRSPYPAQMMPYPAPGQPQPMYAPPPPPNMQNLQSGPQQNGSPNRGRGMPPVMMSPVVPHAMSLPHPGMYASSPVLMHTGRVQQQPIRNDSHPPIQQQQQHQQQPHSQLPSNHQPHNYTPLSYARPAW